MSAVGGSGYLNLNNGARITNTIPSDKGVTFASIGTVTVNTGASGIQAGEFLFMANSVLTLNAGASLALATAGTRGELTGTTGHAMFMDGATLVFDGDGATGSTDFITLDADGTLDFTYVTTDGQNGFVLPVPAGGFAGLAVDASHFGLGEYELIHATSILYGDKGAMTADNLTDYITLGGSDNAGEAYLFIRDNSLWLAVTQGGVPEPAAWAALAGVVLLAYAALRRYRA
ncbi:MAG: hypothetical protein LBK99_08525 [Opitutaceae bacterium]|jgi:hypothetical protein|nr:hypothetical protein [Opitutaceae bacterium]